MTKPRLTCVAPFVPYPGVPHAGGEFLLNYLDRLSDHFEVRLISVDSPSNRSAALRCPTTISVHLFRVSHPRRNLVQQVAGYLRHISGGLTPGRDVCKSFASSSLVRALLQGSNIIEVQWSQYLPLIPAIRTINRSAPLGALLHDVMAESALRRAISASSAPQRVRAAIVALWARKQEPDLVNQCDAAFVFKEEDINLLKRLGARRPIRVFDPFLDTPDPPFTRSGNGHVLFTGALWREENAEAAEWFIAQVWPRVLVRCPFATLTVAGADPVDRVRRLAGPHVTITGRVADLGVFYRSANLFVAPLLCGGGLKFKVPQAMLYALPVVATPLAVEGICPPAPTTVFGGISRSPQTMADSICRLLEDPSTAVSIGEAARRWAIDRFSFDNTISTAINVYEGLLKSARDSSAASHRRPPLLSETRAPL